MTDRELMQMALDALDIFYEEYGWGKKQQKAHEALRARLAQPEPEPVAWADKYDLDREGHDFWVSRQANVRTGVPLYTAPPQREWQGLTEGETIDLALSAFELPEVSSETREKIHRDLVIAMNDQDSRLMLFAANIEAKLKEKNT